MVVQSTLKQVKLMKNQKRQVANIKIALTTKQMLDSTKVHPRETYDELILKLAIAKSPQFSFEGIIGLAQNGDLHTIVNDVIGGIKVFRATKDNIRLECVQNPSDPKVNVMLVKSIPNIDYPTFETLKTNHDGNTTLRFSGDLNMVRILENPSRYGLDHETAFKKLLEQKKEEIKSKDNESTYSFFVLDNGDDQSICIQQKTEDEYRNPIVKGAITIKFDDIQSFITEFHAYGARVVDK